MNLKETYNKIAEDWAQDHNSDGWWNKGTDKFLSMMPVGGSILDVGCGAGIKTKYLFDKGFKVLGIDFSEKMIEAASRRVPKAKFLVKDITQNLNIKSEFDGVFAQAVLLHIPKKDILSVLKKITEPLKTNGLLYVAVKEQRPDEKEEEVVKENDYGYDYERFFSYYTLDEMKSLLTKSGMEIVFENVAASGRRNWIQIISKKSY